MRPGFNVAASFCLVAICGYLFISVEADGYGGIDLKTLIYKLPNRTALCEVLNGTCVAPGDCAVFPNYGFGGHGGHGGYGYGNTGFHRFDCNLTTICCFSIHRFLHLSSHRSHGSGYGDYGHNHGGYGQQKKKELSFKSIVHKVDNRTALCEVLNGTCVSPGDCAVFSYGYGHNAARFDCNLTTICCFSFHRFHHGLSLFSGQNSGYGGHSNGYGGHNSGYGGHNNGYGGHSNGYGGHNSGYGGHNNGYGRQNGGYGSRGSSYGHQRGNRRRQSGYGRSYDYDYSYGGTGYGYKPQRRAWRLSGHDYYEYGSHDYHK